MAAMFGVGQSWRRYNLKLVAPYLVILALTGVVGYRASSLLFAAPTNSGGQVLLTVDQPQYSVGQTVRFKLANNSPKAISVINNCPNEPLEVYYLDAMTTVATAQWQRVRDNAHAAKCVNAPRQYTIEPGAESSASYRYWPDLFDKPGRYRIVAPVEQFDDSPSVEFEVVAQ